MANKNIWMTADIIDWINNLGNEKTKTINTLSRAAFNGNDLDIRTTTGYPGVYEIRFITNSGPRLYSTCKNNTFVIFKAGNKTSGNQNDDWKQAAKEIKAKYGTVLDSLVDHDDTNKVKYDGELFYNYADIDTLRMFNLNDKQLSVLPTQVRGQLLNSSEYHTPIIEKPTLDKINAWHAVEFDSSPSKTLSKWAKKFDISEDIMALVFRQVQIDNNPILQIVKDDKNPEQYKISDLTGNYAKIQAYIRRAQMEYMDLDDFMSTYYPDFMSEHFDNIDSAKEFIREKCNDLFIQNQTLAGEYFYKLDNMLFFRKIGDKSGEFLSDILIPLFPPRTSAHPKQTTNANGSLGNPTEPPEKPSHIITISKTIDEWVKDYKDLFTGSSRGRNTVQTYREDRMQLVLSLVPKLSSAGSVFEYSTQEQDGKTIHTISYLGSDKGMIPKIIRKRYQTLLSIYRAIYAYYGTENISKRQMPELADKIKSVCKKLESDYGPTNYYFYKSELGYYYISRAHLQEFMDNFIQKDFLNNKSLKTRKIHDPNLIFMDTAATTIIGRAPHLATRLNKHETFSGKHIWQYIYDAEELLPDFKRDDFITNDDQTTLFKKDKLNDFINIIKQVDEKKATNAREELARKEEEERKKEEKEQQEKKRKEEEEQNKIALDELKQRIMDELHITSEEYDKIYKTRNDDDDKRWFTHRSGKYRRLHKYAFEEYKNWFSSELKRKNMTTNSRTAQQWAKAFRDQGYNVDDKFMHFTLERGLGKKDMGFVITKVNKGYDTYTISENNNSGELPNFTNFLQSSIDNFKSVDAVAETFKEQYGGLQNARNTILAICQDLKEENKIGKETGVFEFNNTFYVTTKFINGWIRTTQDNKRNKWIKMDELAQRLRDAGVPCRNVQAIHNRNNYLRTHSPDGAADINKWFQPIKPGVKTLYFDSDKFEDYVKLFTSKKTTNKAARDADNAQNKNTTPGNNTAPKSNGTGLIGVIFLETQVAEFIKILQKELDDATARVVATQDKNNAAQRQVDAANQEIQDSETEVSKITTQISEKTDQQDFEMVKKLAEQATAVTQKRAAAKSRLDQATQRVNETTAELETATQKRDSIKADFDKATNILRQRNAATSEKALFERMLADKDKDIKRLDEELIKMLNGRKSAGE